ncbi:HNH endonuclease family protein [Bifidobacterium sp. ESL0763]|uniref:HNH endonuclease family protein n=1 Tax=Bifidobacterium sp. ESL0763 TaxID=2983227 RepID=UPI0023F9D614|nr:HNH endonuclease family protein [Bifidobacterium sp. ESL0763]MDF7663393.1 HNH endonuclease family protein [Bifidobacterium sp. ESL0763]
MAVRLVVLLLCAALAGVLCGLALPRISPPLARITGQYVATGPVAQALAALPVDDRPSKRGYDRDSFGYNTTDDDGNGCTIRDDVLARDMKAVRLGANRQSGGAVCQVRSGELKDPYTGETIRFVRGPRTSSAVQIDHVVALENAWQSGASQWSVDQRRRFGNDRLNLLAVDGPANQEKGAASAAYWLPGNRGYQCPYVARQVEVKSEYRLSVTTQERDAIAKVLRTCPTQRLPDR